MLVIPKITRSFALTAIAMSVAVSGCSYHPYQPAPETTHSVQTSNQPSYLPISAANELADKFECEHTYPVISDPNQVAVMRGFYCVTGYPSGFRFLAIYDSVESAQAQADLYLNSQTGGRKLVVGSNWFVFGLPNDIVAVQNSGLIETTPIPGHTNKYTENQNFCMSFNSDTLQAWLDKNPSYEELLEDAEMINPGSKALILETIARRGLNPEEFVRDETFRAEQLIAEVALDFRPFCLSQK